MIDSFTPDVSSSFNSPLRTLKYIKAFTSREFRPTLIFSYNLPKRLTYLLAPGIVK